MPLLSDSRQREAPTLLVRHIDQGAEDSPGLLGRRQGPLGATAVPGGVVRALERVQVAYDWIRDHDEEGQHPRGRDHPVGVRAGLPHP